MYRQQDQIVPLSSLHVYCGRGAVVRDDDHANLDDFGQDVKTRVNI
jgi:hypothetical protein